MPGSPGMQNKIIWAVPSKVMGVPVRLHNVYITFIWTVSKVVPDNPPPSEFSAQLRLGQMSPTWAQRLQSAGTKDPELGPIMLHIGKGLVRY